MSPASELLELGKPANQEVKGVSHPGFSVIKWRQCCGSRETEEHNYPAPV